VIVTHTRSLVVVGSVLLALITGTPASLGQTPAATPPGSAKAVSHLTDDEIRAILAQRVDKERRAVGIVVGLVTDKGTRIISYGKAKGEGAASPGYAGDAVALERPLDGDTVFEIGSITKTFTGSILADMARKGEVRLEDPVSKYLPAGVRVPAKGGKEITLRLLAQHMSGLPRMPGNFAPSDETNPFKDYTPAKMYEWLGTAEPEREPGEDFEYSNIAYGLLGHALTLKAGMTYEALLKERITGPLGMTDTMIALTPEMKDRLAHGHNERLGPVSNWDLDVMAGAGAIRSTVRDLLKYCAANAGLTDTPLRATIEEAQTLKYPWRKGETSPGSLAWAAPTPLPNNRRLWWHNGGTGGYCSFMGFDREARVGVVVMTNCANSIDELALHIIEPDWPLDVVRAAIKLPIAALDKAVGVYEVGPGSYRTVTRYRDRLFLQRTGQARREILPESERVFFNTEINATVTFEAGADGAITGLVLRSRGNESPAKRVERAAEGKTLVEQDPATYDGLVGRFEETPGFALTVRREGERLLVAATGQPEFEVFPIARDRFTYLPIEVELEFERGADGVATGMTRFQSGDAVKSKRSP
jgi:CubicO group peptidase (beta-lactamase class C family)